MRKQIVLFLIFLNLILDTSLFSQVYFSEYIEGSSYNKALEIYNSGPDSIDLEADHYSIDVYFNGNITSNMTINLSGTVASRDVFVIAASNVNSIDFPLDQVDLFYGTSWYNGDDALVLLQNGKIIDSIGQIANDPGSQWGSGETSTQDNTLRRLTSVTQGDVDPYDSFDPSAEWLGFPRDSFDDLGRYGETAGSTPVVTPEMTPSPAPLTIGIYDIQGQGHQSPYLGQNVETIGIITFVDDSGFYIQDPLGDGNINTSDGIFVYTTNSNFQTGDEVLVQGSIREYVPGGSSSGNLSISEFYKPNVILLSSGNTLPAPIVIGMNGRIPPLKIIDDDAFSVFDPDNDGIDFYESLEGMLVQVEGAMALSPMNKYNEVYVAANQAYSSANINPRKGITITSDNFNPERIQIQLVDKLLPGFHPKINTGDFLGNPRGVMSYAYGNFEILLDQAFEISSAGLEKESTELFGDDQNLSIASYNVENLDPNDDDGDTDVASGKFIRIASQIVNHLSFPDIIALQEIQDNDGSSDSGTVKADVSYNTLIDEIVSAGGPEYHYLDSTPQNNSDGGQPGANIRVGYLYNPARLQIITGSVERIVDDDAFSESRKSLAAGFLFNDQSLYVINNHFASKGGSTALFGQVQPPINGGLEQREAQARVINHYVNSLMVQKPDAKVIVLGDLNEFSFYSPLTILKGEDQILFDMITSLPPLEQYTYNYEGNSQTLDHILITSNMLEDVLFDVVHVNSEFAEQASDHDPLVLLAHLPKLIKYQSGDINHDQKIDIVDAYLLAKYLSGHVFPCFHEDQADVNGDGVINYRDVLRILWYTIRN